MRPGLHPRSGRRGMTLIETMMAMGVLTIGMAAIFNMINYVKGANQTLSFQGTALDAFAQVSSQVRDARCDYLANAAVPGIDPLTTDPGLVAGEGVWTGAGGATPGSAITFVGDATNNPLLANIVPPVRIDYRTTRHPPLQGSPPVPVPGQPNTSYTVEVRVRELKRDAIKDAVALEDGYWIRIFPVEKLCAARTDDVGRGEYQ